MFLLMTSSFLIFLIAFLLTILCFLISKKSFKDREKNSPFECGFDPKNNSRLPFSLQFFLIAIIFIIFDVEITMLIPLIFTYKISNFYSLMYMSIYFIFILLIGIYHEWNQGALNWNI